jgi:hypothetical protein
LGVVGGCAGACTACTSADGHPRRLPMGSAARVTQLLAVAAHAVQCIRMVFTLQLLGLHVGKQ